MDVTCPTGGWGSGMRPRCVKPETHFPRPSDKLTLWPPAQPARQLQQGFPVVTGVTVPSSACCLKKVQPQPAGISQNRNIALLPSLPRLISTVCPLPRPHQSGWFGNPLPVSTNQPQHFCAFHEAVGMVRQIAVCRTHILL